MYKNIKTNGLVLLILVIFSPISMAQAPRGQQPNLIKIVQDFEKAVLSKQINQINQSVSNVKRHKLKHPMVITGLLKLLDEDIKVNKLNVAGALATLDQNKGYEYLEDLISTGSVMDKAKAIQSISQIESPKSESLLIALTKSEDTFTKSRAYLALIRTGHSFPSQVTSEIFDTASNQEKLIILDAMKGRFKQNQEVIQKALNDPISTVSMKAIRVMLEEKDGIDTIKRNFNNVVSFEQKMQIALHLLEKGESIDLSFIKEPFDLTKQSQVQKLTYLIDTLGRQFPTGAQAMKDYLSS